MGTLQGYLCLAILAIMTLDQAAKELDQRLRRNDWYDSFRIGNNGTIFIYVKGRRYEELAYLRDGWFGYPVIIVKVYWPRLYRLIHR